MGSYGSTPCFRSVLRRFFRIQTNSGQTNSGRCMISASTTIYTDSPPILQGNCGSPKTSRKRLFAPKRIRFGDVHRDYPTSWHRRVARKDRFWASHHHQPLSVGLQAQSRRFRRQQRLLPHPRRTTHQHERPNDLRCHPRNPLKDHPR